MSGVSGHFKSGQVMSMVSCYVRCQKCNVMSGQVMSVSGVLGHVRSVRSFQEWVRSVRSCQWCHVMSGHVNHVRSFSKKLLKLTVTVNLLLMQCPKGHIF